MPKSTASSIAVPAKRTPRRGTRKDVIGGSVTRTEKAEIERAIASAGYQTASEGVRDVLLLWARGDLQKRQVA
jgi:hypothetical protein